jgi:signal transduction histidine kinase
MSSALLRFHQAGSGLSEPELVAASVEVSPQPLAITENGKLVYQNASFAQLLSNLGGNGPLPFTGDRSWQTTDFTVTGRNLSLLTARIDSHEPSGSDLHYFAAIGRLVAGVAHDFNNLLTGILLYCDLLQSKAGSDTAFRKRIEEIRRAAEQGAALIRQLMTVGRDQPGEPPSVCFSRVVVDLEHLLQHLLGEQIRIEMHLTEDPGRVGITSAQAQQVILNLAINARDAMPTAGLLRIESRFRKPLPDGNRVFELMVVDTGQGMGASIAAHVFDPFFSTKSSSRGTGLATVKAIIEGAGGNISLESSPGRGTRMIVRLPEVPENQPSDQALDPLGRSTKQPSEDRGATE